MDNFAEQIHHEWIQSLVKSDHLKIAAYVISADIKLPYVHEVFDEKIPRYIIVHVPKVLYSLVNKHENVRSFLVETFYRALYVVWNRHAPSRAVCKIFLKIRRLQQESANPLISRDVAAEDAQALFMKASETMRMRMSAWLKEE